MNILEVFESVKGLTGTIAVSPTSVTVNKGDKVEIYPLTGKAVSINEGSDNEEISFCELELCGHDEGLPCEKLDRVEVRKLPII